MNVAIQINNLTKIYKPRLFLPPKKALSNLTLEIYKGEVFGFLGPNGAGKSTTIKLILDLIKPSSGYVKIFNEKNSSKKIKSHLGYLPEFSTYNNYLTPRELLTMYGRIFKIDKQTLKNRIDELLYLVKMDKHIDERIKTFSKGMIQRIGIAQSLLNEPDLLILDEPASGLDPIGRKEIRDLILMLKNKGKTIFFSSHELTEVETLSDRVAIINKGELLKIGLLNELIPYKQGYEFIVYELNIDEFKEKCKQLFSSEKTKTGEIKITIENLESPYEIIEIIKNLNGKIISVRRIRPNLEETFMITIGEK